MSGPSVYKLCKSPTHSMEKYLQQSVQLIQGIGVAGDAHAGETVKHKSRILKHGNKPNLRQVHLIHKELLAELKTLGFDIDPGQMGENITTEGIDLLALHENTILKLGSSAEIRITGLRNPCNQLNGIQSGLMKAVLGKDENGQLIRKAGVMAVVLKNGTVNCGDTIQIVPPSPPFNPLTPV